MQHHLLAQLPQAERDRWFPKLELIDMPLGQVRYEGGITLKYVYFPTTSIISLLHVMENGAAGEIAVVGNEVSLAYRCSWAANLLQAAA